MSRLFAVETITKDNVEKLYLVDALSESQAKMMVESNDLFGAFTIEDVRPAEPRDIRLFAENKMEPLIMH